MELGISTASLFKRQYNEDAVKTLNSLGVKTCEVFLGTYSEYTKEFATLVSDRKGDMQVHSIHTLNTHFEPQLFGDNPRAIDDAYKIMGDCLTCANILGAKNYTLHGIARFKKNILYNNYDKIGAKMLKLKDFCLSYGVDLCLENVEWAYYNHVGFYREVSRFCPNLKTCLDVKQARISGDNVFDYIEEMGENINTVHLSDVNENGKICLPGRGVTDFEEIFSRLYDKGFNGAMLIEVYNEDYKELIELKESLDYLENIKNKIYK